MSDLLKKATEYAKSIKVDDAYHISKAEFENYAKTDFQAGYICCQKEYEDKLRWIPVEEILPEESEEYKNFSIDVVLKDENSDELPTYGYYNFINKQWCFYDRTIKPTHYRVFL